ncbi:MAG: hypothetical protein KJN59_04950, partial [Bacteroidia bacterium]|nr:hypothetical protein [Bacteroidia bacterium]
MKDKPEHKEGLSRRKMIPLLGSSLLLPILGLGQTEKVIPENMEEEYEILLRADGKAVKVKKSSIENAKVVKKGLSNSSLLRWLGKK